MMFPLRYKNFDDYFFTVNGKEFYLNSLTLLNANKS